MAHRHPVGISTATRKPALRAQPSGYSGTPLARKLGIAANARVVARHVPAGYQALLEPLPPGVVFAARITRATDLVHVFVKRHEALARELGALRARIRGNCAVWVSWPKQASKVATDINEGTIRDIALPLGFVDIKVCAVNEVWSGLKLVIRKALR
jgi:hypothetical protein